MIINDKAMTQNNSRQFSLSILRETYQRTIRKSSSKYCLRSYETKLPNMLSDVYQKYVKPLASKTHRITFSTISYCDNYSNAVTMKDLIGNYYKHKMHVKPCRNNTSQSARLAKFTGNDKIMKVFYIKPSTKILIRPTTQRPLST
jgi:hypothetical protein